MEIVQEDSQDDGREETEGEPEQADDDGVSHDPADDPDVKKLPEVPHTVPFASENAPRNPQSCLFGRTQHGSEAALLKRNRISLPAPSHTAESRIAA